MKYASSHQSNECNKSVPEGDPIHGDVAFSFRTVYIYVFVVQEQKHKQFVPVVLHFEHHFIQHVDILQRANE